jgi:hypothetical protein
VPAKLLPFWKGVDWSRLQASHLTLHKREQLIAQRIRMKIRVCFHDQAGLVDRFS